MAARVNKARADLESQGYVIDRAVMRPLGNITRVWGRYARPVGRVNCSY